MRFNEELKIMEACRSRKDFACAEVHYKAAVNLMGSYTHTEQLNAAYSRMSNEKAKLESSASQEADAGTGFKILNTLIQVAGKLDNESNQNLQQRSAGAAVQQRPASTTAQQQQALPTTSTSSPTTRRCIQRKRLCEKIVAPHMVGRGQIVRGIIEIIMLLLGLASNGNREGRTADINPA